MDIVLRALSHVQDVRGYLVEFPAELKNMIKDYGYSELEFENTLFSWTQVEVKHEEPTIEVSWFMRSYYLAGVLMEMKGSHPFLADWIPRVTKLYLEHTKLTLSATMTQQKLLGLVLRWHFRAPTCIRPQCYYGKNGCCCGSRLGP